METGHCLVESEYHSVMARRASEPRPDRAEQNQAAIRLIRSWLAEPPAEGEREAWEQVKRALDAGRGPGREVFSDG